MDDDKSWKDLADNLSVDGDGDEGSDSELNGLVDSIELTPRMNGKVRGRMLSGALGEGKSVPAIGRRSQQVSSLGSVFRVCAHSSE